LQTSRQKKEGNGCIKESTQKKNTLFKLFEKKKKINDDVHVISNHVGEQIYDDNHFHRDDDDDFDGV
jgi:hypothetical protein